MLSLLNNAGERSWQHPWDSAWVGRFPEDVFEDVLPFQQKLGTTGVEGGEGSWK